MTGPLALRLHCLGQQKKQSAKTAARKPRQTYGDSDRMLQLYLNITDSKAPSDLIEMMKPLRDVSIFRAHMLTRCRALVSKTTRTEAL